MREKMLVTQALDERDLLVKKISDKIDKASFVDTIKPNEDKVYSKRIGKDEYAKEAESAYQQIVDLIERFQKIDAAIVATVSDGAVLVIAANQVSYKFAQNVMEQLKKTKIKIIGSVLNKVDLSENGYYGRYYGKYYGKYYGSYYGHYNSEESPDKSFEKARNASSARKNTNNASKPVKRQAGSVGEVAARKKANVAGNNTGVRKKPSADEFDGDFLMDYDEK